MRSAAVSAAALRLMMPGPAEKWKALRRDLNERIDQIAEAVAAGA